MIIQPAQPQLSMHGATVDDNSVTKANPAMNYQSAVNYQLATDSSTDEADLRLPLEYPEQSNILDDLRRQLEFYFSPYNFANDTYLQQCSAAYGGSVPLSVIASFPKVRELIAAANIPVQHSSMNLHVQIQLLNQALEFSEMLTVSHDGLWIIPSQPLMGVLATPVAAHLSHSFSSQPPPQMVSSPQDATETSSQSTTATNTTNNKERTTIIVRDLPLECEVEDVMNAFTTEGNSPKAVRPDVGNTWYVTFESEAQALEALAASQDRLIEGHPIKARLKSELAAPSTIHVETPMESSMNQQYPYAQQQHQHQPHYNMAMAQHHYPQPYPYINGHHMPYGMAAVYPTNAFYMDHPQHLLVPVPPQMAYTDYTTSQNHVIPAQMYGGGRHYKNYINSNDSNSIEGGNQQYQHSNQPKNNNKSKNKRNNKSKKNRNGPNADHPYDIGNNNNGERRVEQASNRDGTPTIDSQGQDKERRENPSPPHGRNKDNNNNNNDGNEYKTDKRNNYNNNNYNSNVEEDYKHMRNNKVDSNGVNGKKKRQNGQKGNKKKLQHQRSNSNSSSKILNEDQFPALTEGISKQKRNQDVPQRQAYAEALLKPPTVPPAADSIGEIHSGFEQMTVEERKEHEDSINW